MKQIEIENLKVGDVIVKDPSLDYYSTCLQAEFGTIVGIYGNHRSFLHTIIEISWRFENDLLSSYTDSYYGDVFMEDHFITLEKYVMKLS